NPVRITDFRIPFIVMINLLSTGISTGVSSLLRTIARRRQEGNKWMLDLAAFGPLKKTEPVAAARRKGAGLARGAPSGRSSLGRIRRRWPKVRRRAAAVAALVLSHRRWEAALIQSSHVR
ncbi:hypothetical protein E2562_027253, partial [Oryza meyeriana var. granulata]